MTIVTDEWFDDVDISVMRNNRPVPGRVSYRRPGFDYAAPGSFFVTICAHQRHCLFGEIVDGIMHRNTVGNIVYDEWVRTTIIRPEIELDEFVVMPNHVHGIIHIVVGVSGSGGSEPAGAHGRAPLHRPPRSLGSMIAGFKSAATTKINAMRQSPRQPVWQSRYHDRIIRTESSLRRIRAYIRNNPLQWHLDKQNPSNMF